MSIAIYHVSVLSPTFLRGVNHVRISMLNKLATLDKPSDAIKYICPYTDSASECSCSLQFNTLDTYSSIVQNVWLYTPHKYSTIYNITLSRKLWTSLEKYMTTVMTRKLGKKIRWL